MIDINIFVALLGALINLILASTVPVLVKDVKQPFVEQIKEVYKTHGNLIMASTLIVFVTIYLSLRFTPYVSLGLSEMGFNVLSPTNQVSNLANLAQL
jgi:hypothetical protein